MKDYIDYSIIWKYIHSELSKEENDELNQWLETDPRHRLYFEKVIANNGYNTSPELAKGTKIQKIKNTYHLKGKAFKQQAFFIGKVAALIVIVLITGYGIFILDKKNNKEIQLTEINFDPGIQKAILVLNNGEKLELEAGKDTLLRQKEAEIRNTASKLQYKTVSGNNLIAYHQEIEYNTLLVPRGGEYTLVLSDETRVHLNSESMLKFPVNFTGAAREVHLKGEAYFEVKTDPTRPFIVNTGTLVTKVFGTSFNISSYPEKDMITTTLTEGNVTVFKAGENTTEVQLFPGEQSNFSKSAGTIQKLKVDINEYTAWKDGRFVFKDKTLLEITEVLGRWYDVHFVFENPEIPNIRFTGNLKRYENIQQILTKISKTNEIKFTAYENNIYLN